MNINMKEIIIAAFCLLNAQETYAAGMGGQRAEQLTDPRIWCEEVFLERSASRDGSWGGAFVAKKDAAFGDAKVYFSLWAKLNDSYESKLLTEIGSIFRPLRVTQSFGGDRPPYNDWYKSEISRLHMTILKNFEPSTYIRTIFVKLEEEISRYKRSCPFRDAEGKPTGGFNRDAIIKFIEDNAAENRFEDLCELIYYSGAWRENGDEVRYSEIIHNKAMQIVVILLNSYREGINELIDDLYITLYEVLGFNETTKLFEKSDEASVKATKVFNGIITLANMKMIIAIEKIYKKIKINAGNTSLVLLAGSPGKGDNKRKLALTHSGDLSGQIKECFGPTITHMRNMFGTSISSSMKDIVGGGTPHWSVGTFAEDKFFDAKFWDGNIWKSLLKSINDRLKSIDTYIIPFNIPGYSRFGKFVCDIEEILKNAQIKFSTAEENVKKAGRPAGTLDQRKVAEARALAALKKAEDELRIAQKNAALVRDTMTVHAACAAAADPDGAPLLHDFVDGAAGSPAAVGPHGGPISDLAGCVAEQ